MASVTVTNVEKPDDGTTVTSPVTATAAANGPGLRLVIWSMLAVAAATAIMAVADRYWIKLPAMKMVTGFVPYAGIVAVTAALERLLEPLSHVLLSTDETKKNAASTKSAAQKSGANPATPSTTVHDEAKDAAVAQANVDALRTKRTIIFWAIASVCGLGISGGFGLFLLQSITKSHVNTLLDLAVTGLTIGAGTKPVHDLITSIQSKAAS
jgi:hypothetical protein